MRKREWMLALGLVLFGARSSWAGWEIEQTTYNLRSSGKEIGRSSSTMRISKDRIRVNDPLSVSIYDYDKNQVILLLTEKKIFWSGTVDEYLSAVRSAKPNRRGLPGELKQAPNPDLQVQETPITAEIAGKQTKKLVVQVDGFPYQEIWLTDSFLGPDLDLQKYHAMQHKLSQSIRSSYATNLRALGENELYKKASASGFPMRTNTYLGEAIIGTEVVRIASADVPDSEFAIPSDYKRTTLVELIDAQQAIVDRNVAEQKKKADPELLKAEKQKLKPVPVPKNLPKLQAKPAPSH